MRYVSLFSGIEAASVAWGPLGWEPVAYKALGNSMAVPVMQWIGERIEAVQAHALADEPRWVLLGSAAEGGRP